MIMIDTEMPTCCEGCFAQQEYYNPRFDETEYSCGINGENLGTHCRQDWGEWHCDRPEWCPLKEQEAVEPTFKQDNDGIFVWACGSCGAYMYHIYEGIDKAKEYAKYCRQCGRKVKWK